MITINFAGKEYKRMENLFDIGDERFVVFKQWLLQVFENIDKPSFIEMYSRIVRNFNANDSYKIMVELENFKKSLELKNLNYDAYSFCFALLHLQEGELQSMTGSEYQLKKLAEMRKDEVFNRAMVEEVVENFIKASPRHFQHYLEMLEILKTLTKEDISNALAD
jgi:DNA-directed RNA polymerase